MKASEMELQLFLKFVEEFKKAQAARNDAILDKEVSLDEDAGIVFKSCL